MTDITYFIVYRIMLYDLHMQTYASDEHYILVALLLCFSLML